MQLLRRRILAKTLVWLAAEILLNCVGLDHLADYSEFVFEKNIVVLVGWRGQLPDVQSPVGFISFSQISQPGLLTSLIDPVPYQSVMLSYGLAPSYWNQGYMSEATAAIVPWFVAHKKVGELIAFAEIHNYGSRRILARLGFQEEGALEHAMISEDLKDLYQFLLYKQEFKDWNRLFKCL